MGDIGIYVENLVEYILGFWIIKLCVDFYIFVEGWQLDDDGSVLFCFDNGVWGIFYVIQVVAGEENVLYICVYGEKGGLEWY